MEVEDTIGDSNTENDKLKMNASPDPILSEPPIVNGISNGFSEKPKEKSEVNGDSQERDKEKERSRDKDKDRHKHSSSSSSKHRDHSHSSSHKSKSKDRDRDRDKEKDRERDKDKEHKSSSSSSSKDKEKSSSSSSSKHHSSSSSSSKDKHKSSSSSSGDKSKHSSSSSDKHRSDKHSSSSSDKKHSSSSSSSKDKERSKDDKERSKDRDKEKERSRDKDKERDRDKERSKDKEKSRDKDKERSKDKDREKSRDKDKERSKDKHRDKSRDKERSKDDHKEKRKDEGEKVKLYNGEKEKRRSDEGKSKTSEPEKVKIKEEPKRIYVEDDDDDDDFQPVIKKEIKRENFIDDDDDDDEEVPIKKEEFIEDFVPTIKKEVEETIKSEPASETEENSLQIDESMKQEDSEDDIPLSKRGSFTNKRKVADDEDLSDEDVPLSMRKKVKKETKKKKRKAVSDDDEEEDFKPVKKKKPIKKEKEVKKEAASPVKGGRKKKEEEEAEVWKWWEEEKKPEGVKWTFLEHKGPIFAPPYEPLPKDIKFYYDGKPMQLSQDAEEVATFYARMIEHEYTTMEAFNKNFFKDWTSVMTPDEKSTITNLKKCDFSKIHRYFIQKSEERKAMSKEEKKVLKEQNDELQKEYGFCIIDGHKEKIGNFKIEPPGLFRGRGQHPKMGKLKRRVLPEDVLINCSKDSKIPQPPEGHTWKKVRHDNTVTWLASWTENVQGQVKYVMLNPSSKLKGEKDWQKYETARKLAKSVDKIRKNYIADWRSKEMRIRQRAVALYFIDKLALRAGNEKDEDQADTVGCCSLRVEHIKLHKECDGNDYVVEFDFPGKDSIRYHNFVPVEKQVFKNLKLFVEGKKTGDDLFDRLNTAVLNKHLNELMEGLTAKVFRTYNASITLQNQLNELTNPDDSVAEKILSYNRANRAVAILCNHQRSVPKSHEKSMGNLEEKIEKKKEQVAEAEKQVKEAKREAKSAGGKMILEKKQKCLQRLKEQLVKLEVNRVDKDENKTIALGTSKLNYLDPRISVAWCKKHDVPIEKIYNKTQRDKFRWAIDMAGPDYVF